MQNFLTRNSANYLAELTVNADIVRNSWYNTLLSLYPDAVKFVTATVAMFFISPVLGIYVVILALVQTSIPSIFTKQIAEKGKVSAVSQEAHVVTLKENFLSFTTAHEFNIANHLSKKQEECCERAENAQYVSKVFNRLSFEISYAVGNAIYLGIYLVGALFVISGHISIASIIAASQLMVYIASPLTTISGDLAEIKSAAKIADGFETLLKMAPKQNGKEQKEKINSCITLDNINFSYGMRSIINNASYCFEKGKKYLILGESGSGKSTLLRLLSRLYMCDSGTISIDGVNIDKIRSEDYCQLVTCIPQEPFLYDETIVANVRLFRELSDQQVLAALSKAGLDEYISRLPNGIYTKVGENAIQMSGGEKQRLSIARALVGGCPIILMDESTSHLDSEIASEIEQLIFSLSDVMVLFVTHQLRKETLAKADEVLSIKGGNLCRLEVFQNEIF